MITDLKVLITFPFVIKKNSNSLHSLNFFDREISFQINGKCPLTTLASTPTCCTAPGTTHKASLLQTCPQHVNKLK
jgi:hypothetical protein